MGTVRATRHNGRTGKAGVFKAGHNDRSFDVENAGHINAEKCSMNVYWDCYQGYNIADENGQRPERKKNFEQIELEYYKDKFSNSIDAQNERHRKSRHIERIRSVEDILKDKKTCPEESIYQLGTKDGHEDPILFTKVVSELFDEISIRYGTNLKILDWSLHMDEETPHIHERHVFFADDGYGMDFPKQEKACEALGFDLPDPSMKSSKKNNRKISFDSEVRNLFIQIAEKHGVTIAKIPLEGRVHMEKNDFVIAKQQEEIKSNQAILDDLVVKISDIDAMADEVAKKAYEKACEVVTDTVGEETIKDDINIVKNYRDKLTESKHSGSTEQKRLIYTILTKVMNKMTRDTAILIGKIRNVLIAPEIRKRNEEQIANVAKDSIKDRLAKAREKSNTQSIKQKGLYRENDRQD